MATRWTRAAQLEGGLEADGARGVTRRRAPGPSRGLTLLALLASLLACAVSSSLVQAQARELADPFEPELEPRDVALDLHAGTLAPLLVGAGMRVSLPGQLVVGTLLGGVPNAYGEVFGGAAGAYGAGQGTEELVSRFLGGAFVLRVEAGVRPVPHAGLELLAHYTALITNPEVSTAAIDEIAGQPIPWEGRTSLHVSGVLHGFGGELGWAIVPFDGLVIRISVGLTYFAGAAVRLGVPDAMRSPGGPVEQVESRIASTFTTYGIVPYASALAGWRIE